MLEVPRTQVRDHILCVVAAAVFSSSPLPQPRPILVRAARPMACQSRRADKDGAWLTKGELWRIYRDDTEYVISHLEDYHPQRVKTLGFVKLYFFVEDPILSLD